MYSKNRFGVKSFYFGSNDLERARLRAQREIKRPTELL